MKLESLLQYLDEYLEVGEVPDYPTALNGLQVEGSAEIQRIAVAVDASEASIRAACDAGVDLLLVHHGLFWDGLQPLTGRRFRRIRPLVEAGVALYSCHLPLDGHPEVGNAAVLARRLGLTVEGPFGSYRDHPIGWWGRYDEPMPREAFAETVARVVGTAPHRISGGPEEVRRVGVVTGGGGSFIGEAAAAGLDTLVTGEASHHAHFDAVELGVNVLLAGHYATETFGVQALARHLEERFGLEWIFIDQPTGL